MRIRGISYDVGRKMGGNWPPDYDPKIVHREIEILRNDLHCNAVRICGADIDRLVASAEDALNQGLEVWLAPEMWNKTPETTFSYLVKVAKECEKLRARYPNKLVLIMDSELSLFMRGIIPGRTFLQRLKNAFKGDFVRSGEHNMALNEFLTKTTKAVREVFYGKLSYASLMWERVDWNLFDIVGVDHYWDERIKESYLGMMKPLFDFGKPIIITEFGFGTTKAPSLGATSLGNVNNQSRLLHQLPFVGRFVKPRLSKIIERDEHLQAERIIDQLKLLDSAGVDGGFIFCFVSPINPYNDNPKYDLDRESSSLVKSYTG